MAAEWLNAGAVNYVPPLVESDVDWISTRNAMPSGDFLWTLYSIAYATVSRPRHFCYHFRPSCKRDGVSM